MSARVCSRHWQGLALSPSRGDATTLQAPGRSLFLQQATRFPCGRLTATRTRFRLHNTRSLKWWAEYTCSQDPHQDEDVRSNGLDLGLVQDKDLSSKNGYSRSSGVEGSNAGLVSVNGISTKVDVNGFRANGQFPKDDPTEQSDEAPGGPSDTYDLEYYVPVIGHRVVGVVVSGNHFKLDVDIGATKLAHLHVQNLLPLDHLSIDENKWILADDAGDGDEGGSIGTPANGHAHVLYDVDVFAYESSDPLLVEIGTVLEMEVIGETVSGVPLLSARKAASRIAWDRALQVEDLLALR